MDTTEVHVKALKNYGAGRSRSLQTEIGVSQIGGCRRQVWLQLQGTPKTNPTIQLPSLMGTAIHKLIEDAFAQISWGEYQQELEIIYDGLMGHVDLYVKGEGAVVDWKTITKSKLAKFPSFQQRWQVHLYGYLLTMNGNPVKTVELVAIPRDADERSIISHKEEYSPEIAAEALAWLEDVKGRTSAPPPENYKAFCSLYCGYYGESCGGK